MEASVAELHSAVAKPPITRTASADPSNDDTSAPALRALLREKNERIATITTEFDSHRADFRSTIDTLEMASSETERVYEKRVQELLAQVDTLHSAIGDRDRSLEELQAGSSDVEAVARELKDMEDQVAELETETENARRAEADARGEVDHLRRELEHLRAELRAEREKSAKALKDAGEAVDFSSSKRNSSRQVEQRDDEIRGLKAIIHSLNSTTAWSTQDNIDDDERAELSRLRASVAGFEREKVEMHGMMERRQVQSDDLERENARLRDTPLPTRPRPGSYEGKMQGQGTGQGQTSKANRHSNASTATVRPGSMSAYGHSRADSRKFTPLPVPAGSDEEKWEMQRDARGQAQTQSQRQTQTQTQKEEWPREAEGSVSTADEPWCEMCETTGHDILTCKEFGNEEEKTPLPVEGAFSAKRASAMPNGLNLSRRGSREDGKEDEDVNGIGDEDGNGDEISQIAEEPERPEDKAGEAVPSGMPGALTDGPAPGKASGTIDMNLWCAMCERDGHGSTDCPFEDY